MTWRVKIVGTDGDLEYLAAFPFMNGKVRIERDGSDFYLRSSLFAPQATPEEVETLSKRILATLSGIVAMDIHLGSREPIGFGGVQCEKADGTITSFISGHVTARVHARAHGVAVGADGVTRGPTPHEIVARQFDLAMHDPEVERALRLFTHDANDWVGLYRLYEVIAAAAGGQNCITSSGWATEQEIKRFKHTANSLGAVGDLARHGKEQTQPPKNPMDLSAARSLVEGTLLSWLRSKVPQVT